MKGLVYQGPESFSLKTDLPSPSILHPTDVLVRPTITTICGTDLHILKGDVPTAQTGRILGHEAIGIVQEVGSSVRAHKPGDRVLVSCISACATCPSCRRGMTSHCVNDGGWVLGNFIDGTQAELVRIPHADSSLLPLPPASADADNDDAALVLLSDALPTGYECGVTNGRVQPGSTVAVVGAGPVGLACLVTAQLFSPTQVIAIDNDANRLRIAQTLGATLTATAAEAVERVRQATGGVGCDTVIEAVGATASFELCQRLLAPGGTLANIGVHGTKVDLHLQDLWDRNISQSLCRFGGSFFGLLGTGSANKTMTAITTRLVDAVSTPMLLKLVESGKLDASKLITHRKY